MLFGWCLSVFWSTRYMHSYENGSPYIQASKMGHHTSKMGHHTSNLRLLLSSTPRQQPSLAPGFGVWGLEFGGWESRMVQEGITCGGAGEEVEQLSVDCLLSSLLLRGLMLLLCCGSGLTRARGLWRHGTRRDRGRRIQAVVFKVGLGRSGDGRGCPRALLSEHGHDGAAGVGCIACRHCRVVWEGWCRGRVVVGRCCCSRRGDGGGRGLAEHGHDVASDSCAASRHRARRRVMHQRLDLWHASGWLGLLEREGVCAFRRGARALAEHRQDALPRRLVGMRNMRALRCWGGATRRLEHGE
jgi:hypothetical protein